VCAGIDEHGGAPSQQPKPTARTPVEAIEVPTRAMLLIVFPAARSQSCVWNRTQRGLRVPVTSRFCELISILGRTPDLFVPGSYLHRQERERNRLIRRRPW
jgi:hypothetical protein